jgi:hypothetical protein
MFMLLSIMFVLVLITTPTEAHLGVCVHQPDGPDCPCFNNTGAWDPVGAFIQDVAIQTLGTVESCECPGILGCGWPFPTARPTQNEPGKPYYQMVLGADDISLAELASVVLTHCGQIYDLRQTWCTETVAFWHLKTGIPYPGGYRTNWYNNWQVRGTKEMRTWYQTEELLADGRGRWIDACDVNYVDFELGVTVPVPGAYIAYQNFDDFNDTWIAGVHSLIVNEMWVHEDADGTIFQVEVTLLEGNHRGARGAVINTRRWDDVLSITPQGLDWINGKAKIRGIGIDLDSTSQPLYDPARLNVVPWPFIQAPPFVTHVEPNDPVWEHYYAPKISKLVTYAQLLLTTGGPDVTCSSPVLQISGIPDGMSIQWSFPAGLTETIEIVIDLMDVHPLPIKGIELKWDGSFLPRGYRVQYAGADQQYKNALVPDFPDMSQLPTVPSIPVPAIFTLSENGVEVRYVKLIFENTFQQNAILQELRFRYYQPYQETDIYDCALEGDLDGNCRVDFYDVARMAANWLVDCMISPLDPACVPK